jgi:hypothetical protein
MIRTCLLVLTFHLTSALAGAAQTQPNNTPAANPARPTVSNPATLTPVGYLQFETGYLAAWHCPEFSAQSSFNELAKIAVLRRIQLLAAGEPFARSNVAGPSSNAAAEFPLGVQGLVHQGEGPRPTVALSYFRQVYGGNAPDLDIGSPLQWLTILISAYVKGFHYDTNYTSMSRRTASPEKFGILLNPFCKATPFFH